MTTENQYYHCEICGIVVRVAHGGGGTLVCCGQDMTLIDKDRARELSRS
jgi:superoxide reductase